jgi:hypothetical protein
MLGALQRHPGVRGLPREDLIVRLPWSIEIMCDRLLQNECVGLSFKLSVSLVALHSFDFQFQAKMFGCGRSEGNLRFFVRGAVTVDYE